MSVSIYSSLGYVSSGDLYIFVSFFTVGGLGFTLSEIGISMAVIGVLLLPLTILLFPMVCLPMYHACTCECRCGDNLSREDHHSKQRICLHVSEQNRPVHPLLRLSSIMYMFTINKLRVLYGLWYKTTYSLVPKPSVSY